MDESVGQIDEITPFSRRDFDYIMGKRTSREVKPGVWEHTFTPPQTAVYPTTTSLQAFIPKIWGDMLTRKILNELNSIRRLLIREAHYSLRQQNKRERRQHRAAFRRRKRGLA